MSPESGLPEEASTVAVSTGRLPGPDRERDRALTGLAGQHEGVLRRRRRVHDAHGQRRRPHGRPVPGVEPRQRHHRHDEQGEQGGPRDHESPQ